MQEALDSSNALLESIYIKFSKSIGIMTDNLRSKAAPYHDYVVKVFNTDLVKAKLVDVNWDWYAKDWVTLTKFKDACKALPRFEETKKTVLSDADTQLTSSRTFIAVVSTCVLILKTLPTQTKAKRNTLLSAQIAKNKNTGLPNNLMDYMNRELKNTLEKPKGRMK